MIEVSQVKVAAASDAAMGESPASVEPEYLDEYLDTLKTLVQSGEVLKIEWVRVRHEVDHTIDVWGLAR